MAFLENPFTPSFGEIPVHMAGRRLVIDDMERALSSERRRPELTTLFSGARGTGKTALLSLLAKRAEKLGWAIASTTALPGMLEDIELRARKSVDPAAQPKPSVRVASIGVPQVIDLSLERSEQGRSNWRLRMDAIFDQLDKLGLGLLITVDEVDVDLDEMIQLVATYQHFVREGRRVALFMAGLPHNISGLLNDKTVSFLRRAHIITLERIPDYEIEAALSRTIREEGRTIGPEGLQLATQAIGGFPFLMQLVGYRAWDANPSNEAISTDDVKLAITIARRELSHRIHEATYRELSAGDVRFLRAMLEDGPTSRVADLGERLEMSSSQVAQYRRRLIDAGVIGARGRGVIGFDLPFFREYLEEVE